LGDVPQEWQLDVFGGQPSQKLLDRKNIHYKGAFHRPRYLIISMAVWIGMGF
ncbi:hypothetical protein AAULR_25481, partial [Lacticaseibacillus rhamnosus MTCC 5462]